MKLNKGGGKEDKDKAPKLRNHPKLAKTRVAELESESSYTIFGKDAANIGWNLRVGEKSNF